MAGRFWSKREEELLKKLYPRYLMGDITIDEMCALFNRTWQAIGTRAGTLKLTNKCDDKIDEEMYEKLVKRLDL